MKEGVWYYVDYKIKIADEASKPVLQLVLGGNDYRPIYNQQTEAHTFKPIWGDNNQATTVSPNVWHHLKTKFRIEPSTKYISYEVYYDDTLLGVATINNSPAAASITKIITATDNGSVGKSTIYLDDVWFYSKIVKPKIDAANFTLYGLLNEDWSWLGTPANAFDEQLTPVGAPVSVIGTPQGSDPANGVQQGGPLPLYQYSEFGGRVDRPVLLDLGAVYDITDIYIMTKNNFATNTPFQIWYGLGFPTLPLEEFMTATAVQSELATNWTLAYSEVLSAANGYPNNNWISNPPHFDTPIRTRYVILEARGVDGNTQSTGIQEIVFYGTEAEGTTPAQDYTVSFDVNYSGGINPGNVTVSEGDSVALPSVSREGYTLDGWYDAAADGTLAGAAGSDYYPDGNVTLYAYWTNIRTFEPKPAGEDYEFMFTNDFDTTGSIYTTYGGLFIVIDGKNANGTDGKVLKVQGTSTSPEFKISADVLGVMEYGKWYYVDYKFKLEDENSAPKLSLLDSWSPIYSKKGNGNIFKPQWSGDSGNRTVTAYEWHQLKAKIKLASSDHAISYEIYYDGDLLGAADTTMTNQAYPLSGLLMQMIADPDETSVYYYDDVWVYTEKAGELPPEP